MKKYLAIVAMGLLFTMTQPAFSQCGCPITMNPCCPTCPPQVVYQPVLQPVQPVIQTVVEPVLTQTYRYRQVATCPTNPCNPCGITGAAAPLLYPQSIVYDDDGFWEDFFGFGDD